MAGCKTFRQLAAYVIRVGLPVIVPLSLMSQTSPQQQLPLRGFTLLHSEKERAIEKQFMAIPDASKADANLQVLTEAPHMAGSPADRRNAEFVRDQFRSFGLDATIEEFSVVLSEPKHIKMDLIEPVHFSGPNPEFVAQDPASRDPRTTVGFNAYSASGNVTAKVVYANYGLPQDYDELQVQGISVEGTIVLVRYGKCYRGVKAMVAEQHKASAVIIYSDPQDDGYHAGDAYPKGGWRPATGVQRGSVLYDYIYPGVLEDHSNKPRIPVMPLSYADARHILENLSGPVASRDWQPDSLEGTGRCSVMHHHKAFLTLHGREVSGYTIQVLEAGDWGITGELTKQSRNPIPFTVTADEHQFEVTVVLNDMFRDLGEAIRDAERGAKGAHAVRLRY
jgi:N-acetylated-alpha-linked acidic dipeptidase